jgi:hypothetical protein
MFGRMESGTRDSNPRLRPWQFDVRLKTKEHHVSRCPFRITKNPAKSLSQFWHGLNAAEMRQIPRLPWFCPAMQEIQYRAMIARARFFGFASFTRLMMRPNSISASWPASRLDQTHEAHDPHAGMALQRRPHGDGLHPEVLRPRGRLPRLQRKNRT